MLKVIASQSQTPSTTNPASPPSSASQPNPAQKSWVWCHFKLNHKTNKFQFLAPYSKKKGEPCGVLLSQDSTSSTKSMSEYSKRVHHMVLPNQDQTNQLFLPNLMKHQCFLSSFFPRLIFNVSHFLHCGVDAWMSPNMKAFMAVTANGITLDWKMIDVLIGMPAFQAECFGSNFGDILVDMLDDLELSDKLISITAVERKTVS
ncbi:uncharacterized protein VP01_3644g1, partial [Puccinia sorghi]